MGSWHTTVDVGEELLFVFFLLCDSLFFFPVTVGWNPRLVPLFVPRLVLVVHFFLSWGQKSSRTAKQLLRGVGVQPFSAMDGLYTPQDLQRGPRWGSRLQSQRLGLGASSSTRNKQETNLLPRLFIILVQEQEREFAMASRLVCLLGHPPTQDYLWRLPTVLHWADRQCPHKLSSSAVSLSDQHFLSPSTSRTGFFITFLFL